LERRTAIKRVYRRDAEAQRTEIFMNLSVSASQRLGGEIKLETPHVVSYIY
jgi:hypothetical protein